MKTPWGCSDSRFNIERGVNWVGTPSHGGLVVTRTVAVEKLSPAAISCGEWYGDLLCFEEDCAYAVALFEVKEWRLKMNENRTNKPASDAADVSDLAQTIRMYFPEYAPLQDGRKQAAYGCVAATGSDTPQQLSDGEIVAYVFAWNMPPKGWPDNHRLYYTDTGNGWSYLTAEGRRTRADEAALERYQAACRSWASEAVGDLLGKIESEAETCQQQTLL